MNDIVKYAQRVMRAWPQWKRSVLAQAGRSSGIAREPVPVTELERELAEGVNELRREIERLKMILSDCRKAIRLWPVSRSHRQCNCQACRSLVEMLEHEK